MEAVAPGGTVVQVGLGEDKCCIPAMQAVFKEVHFTGSWRYVNIVSVPALPATIGSALPCPILICPYLHVLLQHVAAKHARSHACSLQQFHLIHNHLLSCN